MEGSKHRIFPFLCACWKVNLASALEYRMSFFLMAGMMFINNLMWLFFWSLFFQRFPVVNGWELTDVMMLWAVSAGGFGWVSIFFGNFSRLAELIANGQLDVYLSQPKPVLLHLLVSRMSLTAIGDFLFAIAIYCWVGEHTVRGMALFALSLFISGLLFLSVMVLVGSLSFFVGNAEGVVQQTFNSFVALTTYPASIFKGWAKIILFTVFPAGLISSLPIGLLREFDPVFTAAAIGGTLLFFAGAMWLFHLGLRRYASGNAMLLRG
ncbi:ABC transporter permease [Paenibacillus sp. GCM10027626]|uniref:ABC transporter permease n=1 Tax=Paenibacillus sp. GCM10027626 TaxID=3273411 RepID=UPI0036458AE9